MKQSIIFSQNLEHDLQCQIDACKPDRLFVLTDANTHINCYPVVKGFECLQNANLITIPAGDTNKNLDSISHVWQQLQEGGATRHSMLVNLGGGMLTDLGGFAASTFKRGISFVNIPTTLLAMVDASVGGKTGINFLGFKNEIGVFSEAQAVIIDTQFLRTLDHENLFSGYAEMLKHALIADESMWSEHLLFLLDEIQQPDNLQRLQQLIEESVAVKERIVTEDPHEQGLRKALNLGHTFGHALEEWSLKQPSPLLHGYAVAHGLICELYLSAVKCGFPTDKFRQTVTFIREHYGTSGITCRDYPELLQLMTHDKKNIAGTINFTLLANIGDLRLNQTASDEEIREALDFLREG
ncbi:MAG: 3-dehydroquinate synthase [Prevotella sp.]|nr:3-dehydroquinate synthase [Prevotella sp.]